MPKKNNSKEEKNENLNYILFFCLSVFMFCLVFIKGENIWTFLRGAFLGLFGINSIFLPFFLLSVIFFKLKNGEIKRSKFILIMFFAFFLASCFCVFSLNLHIKEACQRFYSDGIKGAGVLSGYFGILLIKLFGITGARAFLALVLFLISVLVFGVDFSKVFEKIKIVFNYYKEKLEQINFKITRKTENSLENLEVINTKSLERLRKSFDENSNENSEEKDDEIVLDENAGNIAKATAAFMEKLKLENENSSDSTQNLPKLPSESQQGYNFPKIELLNEPVNPCQNDITIELNTNGKLLIDTLSSFKVKAKIVDINRGPAVTRYEIQPASGVKVSKITTLSDDIALNLAALGVRIEAPIPGKSAIGIEIPNKVVSIVSIREIIESEEFINAKSSLSVVLGRDISGKAVVTDLGKMPHLIIAGATGAGKSVCVNSFIISLLYKATPEDVKLLMIDPKVVELGVYNGIPHLLVPVVTDPKKSSGALNWAVNEMLSRYKIFAEVGVRDIASYNNFVGKNKNKQPEDENTLKKMARIVIIIDELSDLMMAAPSEIEDYICRLTQMARAAGMHLVIATQRPSVDVITGIIKANVPSRIALAVSSQVDSRTILDMGGAEKLLGRGDMLFSPIGANKPVRVQGCYVTDEEIERVVGYVKGDEDCVYDAQIIDGIEHGVGQEIESEDDDSDSNDEDPMMNEAIKCVVEAGQASTSLLQRRLRLGYARAGRLIDQMEQLGIVGPSEGSKARQVIMTYQEYLERSLRE
ncbi:MAG: DNA translocase FtsK [Oscillospiraceae bacterium]|jgi:S-DNA-T family DNA segregation ATPase FtsK/SpoIIIE|nr:DNA translocase FtsK [Oscillospiraceae bacterium]